MRMIRGLMMSLGMLSFLMVPATRATDVPVVANKLVIIDKTARTGLAKAVLTAKDAAVTKGSGTNPANVSALLHVRYNSVGGQFAMPAGDDWVVNSASVAKYVNQDAPAGGSVKIGIIKPGALLKVVGKSLGDAASTSRSRRVALCRSWAT